MTDQQKTLIGQWQAIEGTLGGTAMPAQIIGATKLRIESGQYEVNLAGTIDSGKCTINTDVTPIQMTIEGQSGPNQGKTFLAIVEMIGDSKMRIAYDLSGTNFPKLFEPTSEKSNYVARFERVK